MPLKINQESQERQLVVTYGKDCQTLLGGNVKPTMTSTDNPAVNPLVSICLQHNTKEKRKPTLKETVSLNFNSDSRREHVL